VTSIRSKKPAYVALAVTVVVVVGAIVGLPRLSAYLEPPTKPGPDPILALIRFEAQQAANFRDDRILSRLRVYRSSCDPSVLAELTTLMREAKHDTQASALEAEPCQLPRPSCAGRETKIGGAIARRHQLVRDAEWELVCFGVNTKTGPGFAVTVHTAVADVRGITSLDGERDLVPFSASRGTLVGVTDLDGDHIDELVTAGASSIVATQLGDAGFVDIKGPPIAADCKAAIAPAGDKIVLSVAEKQPHCPSPGRHHYALRNAALVALD